MPVTKAKTPTDKAKEEIVNLLNLWKAGTITQQQYEVGRLKFVEVLGTRHFYNDDGTLKDAN